MVKETKEKYYKYWLLIYQGTTYILSSLLHLKNIELTHTSDVVLLQS